MIIRNALKNDQVAHLILSAAKELFIDYGVDDLEECAQYLFSSKNNKFSYENSYVCEIDNKVVALIIFYQANEEKYLASNQKLLLDLKYNINTTLITDESIPDTCYLDTLAVDKNYQKKGIASKLIKKILTQDCSLLCDTQNKNALNFYLSLGFEIKKCTNLYDHRYYKMLYSKK